MLHLRLDQSANKVHTDSKLVIAFEKLCYTTASVPSYIFVHTSYITAPCANDMQTTKHGPWE